MLSRGTRVRFLPLLIVFALLTTNSIAQSTSAQLDPEKVGAIQKHIALAWDRLTRSMSDCNTVVDSKLANSSVLYLPARYPVPPEVKRLQQECHVEVKTLPAVIHDPGEVDTSKINPHGLLFLENKYVVPGGPFNEMYGWDSYFIIRGLVRDGRVDLARGMVENFFFEIEHYGTILNANRTYYLTRSQPPFLSAMIMSVYEAEQHAGKADKVWLKRAYQYATRDYRMWTTAPHLAGTTGLSRYYDFGNGVTPESPQDEGAVQRQALAYMVAHPAEAAGYFTERPKGETGGPFDPTYTIEVCENSESNNPGCEPKSTVHLTTDYFKGDRAMRESGYDISFRFGPYGAGTHHFAPVCLNSLLYKTEKDLAAMARILGEPGEAEQWEQKAKARVVAMDKLFWDDQRGEFLDYDFVAGKRSTYDFATTFYPLWTGWATREQARVVVENLKRFELAGGIVASRNQSGVQWDFPFGWAPQQLFAVDGLRQYGYYADAERISTKFLSTVMENFQRDGYIVEKYNMLTRSSDVKVAAGYQMNAVGFGWTNGVFLVLLDELSKAH